MDITKVFALIESILSSSMKIGFYIIVILIIAIIVEFLVSMIIKNVKER